MQTSGAAVEIVHWFSDVFDGDRAVQREEREILGRLTNAFRPVREGQKAALAARLVEEHAFRYLEALTGGSKYKGNSQDSIVEQLCVSLWSLVDEAFGALDSQHTAVGALLARFEPNQHKRRTSAANKAAGKGKLAASGIVAELNKMARWPLGRRMSAKGVSSARTR
jgi:hypothetical protein